MTRRKPHDNEDGHQGGDAGEELSSSIAALAIQLHGVQAYVREHGEIRRKEVIDLCQLGPNQATRLLRKLLLSLEDLSVDENLELWVQESERRLQELRADPRLAVDADEAIAEARASLKHS